MPDFDMENDRLLNKDAKESFSSEEEVIADDKARYHTIFEKIEEQLAKIEEDGFEEDKNNDEIFMRIGLVE